MDAPPPPLTSGKKRAFGLLLLAGVLAVLVSATLGAEFAVRYRERHRKVAPDFFACAYYPHTRVRYGLIPGLDYFGWFKINSLGFRGREFSPTKTPGTIRILCIGGSTTFDIGSIGKNLPWPEVLEKELQKRWPGKSIEVLNLAVPGATSLDSLIDLQIRGLGFEPDIVVLYQAHNDFNYSLPAPHPKKSYLFPWEQKPRSRFYRWIDTHSVLWGKTQGIIRDFFDRIFGLFRFSRQAAGPGEDRRQAIARGLSTFRTNLRSFVAVCREHGIRLVLPQVVIPYRPSRDATGDCQTCAGLPAAYGGLPAADIKATFDQYTRVLEELGPGKGVYFIRTDGFVPSSDRFYHDSVHFNPEGSIRMGAGLAAAMEPVLAELGSRTGIEQAARRE